MADWPSLEISITRFKDIGPFNNGHLDFTNENGQYSPVTIITGENGTGKTIILDAIRTLLGDDILSQFHSTLLELPNNQIRENGRELNDAEISILRRFASPDYPFSLMFKLLLRKLGFESRFYRINLYLSTLNSLFQTILAR